MGYLGPLCFGTPDYLLVHFKKLTVAQSDGNWSCTSTVRHAVLSSNLAVDMPYRAMPIRLKLAANLSTSRTLADS